MNRLTDHEALVAIAKIAKIAIDRNVPIPPKHGAPIPANAWPFDEMRPGDSFLIPLDHKDKRQTQSRNSSINHAIRRYRQTRPERQFTCRTVDGGIRCWRIA